jgi:hypothetical protein
VLRRIFGLKRDEVVRDWRRLHNEELYTLFFTTYCSGDQSRSMRWAGHVARMREVVHTGVDGRI